MGSGKRADRCADDERKIPQYEGDSRGKPMSVCDFDSGALCIGSCGTCVEGFGRGLGRSHRASYWHMTVTMGLRVCRVCRVCRARGDDEPRVRCA